MHGEITYLMVRGFHTHRHNITICVLSTYQRYRHNEKNATQKVVAFLFSQGF